MTNWLRAFFSWREVRDQGVWLYLENAVTGRRKAVRVGRCWSPLDFEWLSAGIGGGVVIDDTARRRVQLVPEGAWTAPTGAPPRA